MEPESRFSPRREVNVMSDGKMPNDSGLLPDKEEERGLLTRVTALVPLFSLIIQILELVLKILKVIN